MLVRMEMLSKFALGWKSQWLESSHSEPFVERMYHLYINMMTVTEALLSAPLTRLAKPLPPLSTRKASWVEKESPLEG